MKTTIKLLLLFILLLNTGCGLKTARDVTPTPTRIFVTATFLPTFTPIPSETPIPNPPTPTTVPVQGIASTQINVRAQPSTAGQVLGIVAANATLQIVGKDPGGSWWQILYPASPDGLGWVTAQYVTVTGTPDVPMIGGGGATQSQPSGNIAILQQQLNIRSGPGTDFNSLGTLNPQDVVNLIGKDANGAWLQIEFAAGPEGKGWINAAFVQAQGVENLPIVTEAGQVVGTGTPTGIPPTPTATVIPAPTDGDSAENPAVNMSLSATGTRSFQFSGDVSSPEGDIDDWIQFTPYTQFVRVTLECSGTSQATLEVIRDMAVIDSLLCGESAAIPTLTGIVQIFRVFASNQGELQYSAYNLQVSSMP